MHFSIHQDPLTMYGSVDVEPDEVNATAHDTQVH